MVASFKERLAAAKAAPRPTRDVTVALDSELAAQRNSLAEQIDEERKRPIDARLAQITRLSELEQQLADLDATEAENLVTVRFVRADGDLWASVTSRHPADPDSYLARRYGFDLVALTKANAWRWATREDGDEWVAWSERDWADFTSVLSGADFLNIQDAVFILNVWEPEGRVEALKKASLASSEQN